MGLTATPRWKEELIINDESGRTFTFDCGWGVNPPVAYVPPPAKWQSCVPVWLRDRRAEVIEAMKNTGHVVKDGPYSPITGEP